MRGPLPILDFSYIVPDCSIHGESYLNTHQRLVRLLGRWSNQLGLLCLIVCIGCSPDKPNDSPSSTTGSGPTKTTESAKQTRQEATSQVPSGAAQTASSGPPTTQVAADSQQRDAKTTAADFDQKFAQATELLDRRKADEAWKLCQELMIARPNDAMTQFLTARVLSERGDKKSAIAMMAKISEDDPIAGAPAMGQIAQWLSESGELVQAEAKLLKLLKAYPKATPAMHLLVRIYNAQGRRWETARWLDRLVRLGDFTAQELSMAVDYREPYDEPTLREAAAKIAPEEPYNQLGLVRLQLHKNRWQEQFPVLKSMNEKRTGLVEPWIWYASCLHGLERSEELARWMETPPQAVEKHPEYWYLRGSMLSATTELQQAARCFVEAIVLDRRHVGAHQGLADCLLQLNDAELAQRVREFAKSLIRINDLVQQILLGHASREAYLEIAQLYSSLNDDVGEFAWKAILLVEEKKPFSEEIIEQQKKLSQSSSVRAASLIDLRYQDWTLPSVAVHAQQTAPLNASAPSGQATSIRMDDVAEQLGITSQYDNGSKPGRGWYTVEGIGGGVSVLDYDLDGWPDMYFGQAGDSALSPSPVFKSKQLYRSLMSRRFVDVTSQAYVADIGYGQGTGAVDIDQDGFRDLLVANLGSIAYYRNQGDGTFEAVALPQAEEESVWNSSISAADINGDSLPDIIQGCYTFGKESITRWCAVTGTQRGSCNPKAFPPGKNRVLFNSGDGTWVEADTDLLNSIRQGYTLGTAITNLDQRNGNDVYFANDVSPNHLLLSTQDKTTGQRSMREVAASAGVSVDGVGRAQASMGISVGDQNRDGMLDLITTNFRDEFSTLYLQTSAGLFTDGTRRSGLGMPTLPWVSFGCQLADLENDGWLDFVAVNGHIDDYQDESTPWKMPSQVLQNQQGHFAWLKEANSPGAYFDGAWIGRGLASLDFNRDGKIDMVATHLDRAAALLENKSEGSNHYLQLELIGTRSEREATGAIVHVYAGKQTWVTSVTAGEGFYGSNQHLIHMGLGAESKIDKLVIDWPSGTQETIEGMAADQILILIEGVEAN